MSTTPFPELSLGPELGFARGTRVHTKEGLRPIESVRVGDWVLTHPLDTPPPRRRRLAQEVLYKRVTRIHAAEVQSLLQVTVQNLADGIEDQWLVATGQPIWVQPVGWLAAIDLRRMQPLVLSFNGNALVHQLQRRDQAARVFALEVEDCSSYYVEPLGTWVGADPQAVVQAPPVDVTRPPIDFSQPQVLLKIENYYNDTLAPPEAPPPAVSELAAQMQAAAEKLRSRFKAQLQQDLGYDEAGLRWLDDYIERARLRPSEDQHQGAMHMIGAFLGECTVRSLGGQWSTHEGMPCVALPSGDLAFPHNKVLKHYRNGREAGDSILGFYRSNLSLQAALHEGPPASSSGAHFVPPMPPQPELEQIIIKLRASFEQRQQRMNSITLGSVIGPQPPWVKATDGLNEFFDRQELLLTEGHIVWGALVQANQLLFKPGVADCPGLLVHSPDPYFDARPEELRTIGRTFFSFKNTDPSDPELKEVARLVTDEVDRSMGFELPRVFSSKPLRSATFMVFRKHVPNGVLSAGLFPILTHPSTAAVMMVPFEFWPIELIVLWKENRL